mgnify:CR=1 FL=1
MQHVQLIVFYNVAGRENLNQQFAMLMLGSIHMYKNTIN